MRDLSDIRADIDRIDHEIEGLYEKRLACSREVARLKAGSGKAVYDREREESKIRDLVSLTDDAYAKPGIRELFTQIMSASRTEQYRILSEAGRTEDFGFRCVPDFDFSDARIVYQGVEGAYSEAALVRFFGADHEIRSVKTWRDAFEALKNHTADYAVLPIENSTAGAVTENYDLLTEYDASIIGEQIIRIDHALLGLPDAEISDVRTVYSHPQALMQCENYLNEKHPEFETRSVLNTAAAARKVRQDGRKSEAAIAGKINAKIYGLKVLEESIQDDSTNATRFLVISEKRVFLKDAGTLSLAFELPDNTGSLYQVLSNFTYNGINMTRIESRPVSGRPWAYRFFVDCTGNLLNGAVQNMLNGLRAETGSMRILGNY